MLNSKFETQVVREDDLRSLLKQVHTDHNLAKKEKQQLIKTIQFFMKYPVAVDQLSGKIQKMLETCTNEKTEKSCAQYPSGLSFDELNQTGNLIRVNNTQGKQAMYLYFDEESIVKFNKLNPRLQDKFLSVCKEGNLRLAAAKNEQGIKYLGINNALPKCHLNLENRQLEKAFRYEIKVQGVADRIGVIVVDPIGEGPQLMIATHVIKGGFHNNKHNGKTFSLNKVGFFAKTKNCIDHDVKDHAQSSSKLSAIRVK